MAHLLGAGRVDEAVRETRALLEHHRWVLGPDHPDRLRTRNNLARWLDRAEDI